jgi:hypothetical protein
MRCALQGLDELRASTLADIQAKSAAAVASRRPLARKPDKAAAVKLYNPRFEEDYVAGKDFDPDRCRVAGCTQGPHVSVYAAAICKAAVTMRRGWGTCHEECSVCCSDGQCGDLLLTAETEGNAAGTEQSSRPSRRQGSC